MLKTARFGNVAFSKGSLLNSFDQRINSKQPIPVPKNVFRYFLTEKEAGIYLYIGINMQN